MNNWHLSLAITSLVFYLAGMTVWWTLRQTLERAIWRLVFIGFLAIIVHGGSKLLFSSNPITDFGPVLISYVALLGSLAVRRFVRQTIIVHKAFNSLDSHELMSVKLAEHLAAQRAKLDFYEAQAKRLGLPLHPEEQP